MRVFVMLTAALIAGCGGSGNGASAGSVSTPPSPTTTAFGSCPPPSPPASTAGSVGAIVDDLVAQELPGMTVGLAKQGRLIYAQAYGYADLSDCLPLRPDTPFELDSVTKTFTATTALQLQSIGALDIDNPVFTYLPDYAFDPRITVRMLLNMTSGLADYLNDTNDFPQSGTWEAQGASKQTVLTAIAQVPLRFVPGSAFQYSNSNYFVLGAILEAVSGESYSDYLSANIIGPLGLAHTSYEQPAVAALPYFEFPAVAPVAAPIFSRSIAFSAGALWSDVQDLATFDAALFNGKVLPVAQFTEMVTLPDVRGASYAMGWSSVEGTVLNRPYLSHNGGSPGSGAHNGLFLDDGFSISILTNGRPNDDIGAFAVQVLQAVCTSSATAC